jgi:hypothetical protein
MQVSVVNGVRSGWTPANNKNSELSRMVFGDNVGKLPQKEYRKYFGNNDKALDAFLERKTAGLNLSDRVWNCTGQFKAEIEMGLDSGIRGRLSAAEAARDLKQYLNEPDRLYRRFKFRDGEAEEKWLKEHPDWKKEGLKKPDGIFNPRKWKQRIFDEKTRKYRFADVDITTVHPGRGVYRSSYKNAVRLARTEINMAYHTADYLRWQQLDFVVGIEVHLSNNHTLNGRPFADICDGLAGKYPKDFKFTGWHPQCRCFAIPVLKTENEMMRDNERIMNGEEPSTDSVNSVTDVPDSFTKWVGDNKERIEKADSAGTLPYFIGDNKVTVENIIKAKEETVSGGHKTMLSEQVKKPADDGQYNRISAFIKPVHIDSKFLDLLDDSISINIVNKTDSGSWWDVADKSITLDNT